MTSSLNGAVEISILFLPLGILTRKRRQKLYLASYLQVILIMFDISIEVKGKITCPSDEKLEFLLVEEQKEAILSLESLQVQLAMNNICLFA